MAADLTKLATEMASDRKGLSTTAWLMKKFEVIKREDKKEVPNEIVILESVKAKASNHLQELSAEVVDQNNYTIKERLSRLAQENPTLYKSFASEVQALEDTAAKLKSKKEELISEYKSITTEVDSLKTNPSVGTTSTLKSKLNDLLERVIREKQSQTDLEYKQAKLFDTIFIAASQAGISLPAEKKKITPSV